LESNTHFQNIIEKIHGTQQNLPEHCRKFWKTIEIYRKSWKKPMEACRTQQKLPDNCRNF
jgi:hypothetical protein